MKKNKNENVCCVGKKQHFSTSLAKEVSVVISGFLPTKKTFFDENKRILLNWTAFKHHQKQKPRGRKKTKKEKLSMNCSHLTSISGNQHQSQ